MSEAANFYRVTPRQTREFIIETFESGLVPFVQSSPGMGKSSIYRSVADYLNLEMIDHRVSTSEPTDFNGMPNIRDGKAKFVPFEELFPLDDTPLPKGKDGWLIFLDEYNAGVRQVQAAGYKVLLDRMIGQRKLHSNVCIGLAGNLITDRSITTNFSTASQSRVITLEMEISYPEWLEDVALKEGYDSRIIAFLSQYPSKLFDFRPDHNEKTFCCPRTWEFMNRLITDPHTHKPKDVPERKTALYAGTITSGVAADFVQFTQIYKELIDVKEILRDPKVCRLPHDNGIRWATIAHMMEKVDDYNFGDLSTYANRFSLDYRILFYRSAMVQHPTFRQHPAFSKALIELTRYLSGP